MDKPMMEWIVMPQQLTPEEEAKRAELQAELDRWNEDIKILLQQIANDLNVALARRLPDETKR